MDRESAAFLSHVIGVLRRTCDGIEKILTNEDSKDLVEHQARMTEIARDLVVLLKTISGDKIIATIEHDISEIGDENTVWLVEERKRALIEASYRDDTWPERSCDHCGQPYRGRAVYCSLRCALADA